MIYFDSSALITLVTGRRNAHSLREFLGNHAVVDTCTSTIGFVETVRTCDAIGDYPNLLARLLDVHIEIPVTDRVRDTAVNLPRGLRGADAIHVASAELLGGELTALVTYDKAMATAARGRGLPVASPV